MKYPVSGSAVSLINTLQWKSLAKSSSSSSIFTDQLSFAMKKILPLLIILLAMQGIASAQTNQEKKAVLRHVVMFGWKEGTDTAAIAKIVAAFRELPANIPQIKAMEWGTNNSPEGLNNGLTHCFILSFDSEADRDAYLVHPAHKEFGGKLKPAPGTITVFDFWAQLP